jgi:glycerophosphoryl diester phosphodiesterase
VILYSHRGIDFDRRDKMAENSLDAFRWAATQGFGIELDLQMTRDQVLIVAHDATVESWTGGKAKKAWSSFSNDEILKLETALGPIARFTQVLSLAKEFPQLQLAIHLKGTNQSPAFVHKLVDALSLEKDLYPRTLIFDLKLDVATTLRRALPGIGLAPSVSDEYDISRYQSSVNGTLMSVEDVLTHKQVFNWVWMDEWDRSAMHDPIKTFYASEHVERLRKKGFKIALISPELHKAEGHQDGVEQKAMQARWFELIELKPDAICTDYPARLSLSLKNS